MSMPMMPTMPTISTIKPTDAELACFDEIDLAIAEIVKWHTTELPNADIEDFRDNLHNLILNGGSPSSYFELIGFGSYKEAYAGLGDWIIKFYTIDNDTKAERQLLEKAHKAGLGHLFLNTIFIELPRRLMAIPEVSLIQDSTCFRQSGGSCGGICDDCQWNTPDADHDENILCGIQMQPRAYTSDSIAFDGFEFDCERYYDNPVKLNDSICGAIPYKQLSVLGLGDKDWLRSIIINYGDNACLDFLDFALKVGLKDLHSNNTGYLKTSGGALPVILDWLSNC